MTYRDHMREQTRHLTAMFFGPNPDQEGAVDVLELWLSEEYERGVRAGVALLFDPARLAADQAARVRAALAERAEHIADACLVETA